MNADSGRLTALAELFGKADHSAIEGFRKTIPPPPFGLGQILPQSTNPLMRTSRCGVMFIAFHKDVDLPFYLRGADCAGNRRVGTGHYLHPGVCNDDDRAQWGDGLTKDQALGLPLRCKESRVDCGRAGRSCFPPIGGESDEKSGRKRGSFPSSSPELHHGRRGCLPDGRSKTHQHGNGYAGPHGRRGRDHRTHLNPGSLRHGDQDGKNRRPPSARPMNQPKDFSSCSRIMTPSRTPTPSSIWTPWRSGTTRPAI
jgi:hypothetical protein